MGIVTNAPDHVLIDLLRREPPVPNRHFIQVAVVSVDRNEIERMVLIFVSIETAERGEPVERERVSVGSPPKD